MIVLDLTSTDCADFCAEANRLSLRPMR